MADASGMDGTGCETHASCFGSRRTGARTNKPESARWEQSLSKEARSSVKGIINRREEAHAEVHAINHAGAAAHGGTLYVTLEPCSHYGRTPPCTETIIQSGIARVFAAHVDPNSKVGGKGIQELEKAGVQVNVGLCEPEARRLNEVFIKYIRTNQPFVILKSAMSLDGKIATASGESKWISSEASQLEGHEIRNSVDAVLVGVNTVINDNPSLTTRLPERVGKDPARIVVDSECRTPSTAKVFNPDSEANTIIATTKRASKERIARLEAAGAKVVGGGGRRQPRMHDRTDASTWLQGHHKRAHRRRRRRSTPRH